MAVVQYTFTHEQYTEQDNEKKNIQNRTYITISIERQQLGYKLEIHQFKFLSAMVHRHVTL